MKAIVPVAGIGNRLKPHTQSQPKSLMPVAGKAILGHVVDSLVKTGITEFIFIIGYQGDKIKDYLAQNYSQYQCTFVIQTTGQGTAHAIYLAKDLVDANESLVILLGDSILEFDLTAAINAKQTMVGVKKVDDPRLFGVAEINELGNVSKLIEKPAIPKSNLALVGLYYINHAGALLQSIANIMDADIRTQNEFYLTDALQNMLENGFDIGVFNVESWFDCGKKDIILQTNANLLRHPQNQNMPLLIFEKNNIIIPPVHISSSAIIINSIIGPNVSIGDKTEINACIVGNSIIAANSTLEKIILQDSLLGNDSTLIGNTYSLNIGDNAEVNFS